MRRRSAVQHGVREERSDARLEEVREHRSFHRVHVDAAPHAAGRDRDMDPVGVDLLEAGDLGLLELHEVVDEEIAEAGAQDPVAVEGAKRLAERAASGTRD